MFYDRFLSLCEKKGVSPTRAAVDAGISKSLVTKWKSNRVEIPSPDVLRKISSYFNVPVSELLNEENIKTPTVTDERIDMNDVDVAFYGDFKELSDDDKATIRDMVRIMRQRRANKP